MKLPAEVLGKADIGGDVEAMPNEDGVLVKRVLMRKPRRRDELSGLLRIRIRT